MDAYNICKLKLTVIILLCLILNQLSNPAWAERETNEIPLYGGKLTAAQQKANESFLKQMDSFGATRPESAKHAIMRGWEYLNNNHQPLMAIKRFNQAWLLDPNNAQIYWGLGAAQSSLGEFQDGVNLITRAAKMDKGNSEIVTDIGRSYMGWAASTKDNKLRHELFDKAIKQYQLAEKLNPKSAYTYSNWAFTLFYDGKYAAAWQMVKKARALGRSPDPKFIQDLSAKFPEPK